MERGGVAAVPSYGFIRKTCLKTHAEWLWEYTSGEACVNLVSSYTARENVRTHLEMRPRAVSLFPSGRRQLIYLFSSGGRDINSAGAGGRDRMGPPPTRGPPAAYGAGYANQMMDSQPRLSKQCHKCQGFGHMAR